MSLIPFSSPAISVGGAEKDTSPEAELASFTVLEGFEVNLFASEKDGVVNPISIRWDELGRLWVLTSPSYPQAEPGVESDDKILILEDTDGDGKSDKTTVFADKLRMPMGLELAAGPAGAAYVGEGEKLWLMRDTDGDGKADVKEVVFSGFGTGDTHQSINSFTWTPDGALLFSQGLHCASNVTTAWGGRKLYGAGFWLYRPLSGKLTPYPTGFPLNAWGTVYDDHGQPFTVAGAAGMFWTTPLLISSEHRIEGRALPNNGQIVKEGMLKYCGVDIPRNAHWPAEMHGELVSGGFFENCIYRHKLQGDKANPSGYEAVRQPDLLKSSSIAFRPVDVKFGPEGALYISDWYNPIIGHYQASFRHPDRDKTHGRIWRVVKKDAALAKKRDLGKMDVASLFEVFEKGQRWEQYQAQRLLMGRSTEAESLREAVSKKGSYLEEDHAKRIQSLFALDAWFEVADMGVRLFSNGIKLPQTRALAARTVGLWADRLSDPLSLLALTIADENPRVRLETIAACAQVPKAFSVGVALRALDMPRDSFIDRALELTIHALAPHWEPALAEGQLTLPPRHLAYLLEKKSSPAALARVREMLTVSGSGNLPETPTSWQPVPLDAESRRTLLLLLVKQGIGEDVAHALKEGSKDSQLLSKLADIVENRKIEAPKNAFEIVVNQFSSKNFSYTEEELTDPINNSRIEAARFHISSGIAAIRLAGLWKITSAEEKLYTVATNQELLPHARRHAIIALERLNSRADTILRLASDKEQPWLVRLGAVEALCVKNPRDAAQAALSLLAVVKEETQMQELFAPFLAKTANMKALITALQETPCSQEAADLATRALIGIGRNEPELTGVLNKILGRAATTQPFDAQWVSSLGNETTTSGNAKHGKEIFERPALNCIACHQIGGKGGIIGPQLDALGRGVPMELIIEAVMWPQRQIKEGYTATTVTTKDGRTLMGYKTSESDSELGLRDMAVGTVTTLPKSQLATRTDAGSLMPEGLTASLSREELRDLIAYLASLGK